MLDYVPKLTKDQFVQTSFATQKCQMTIDLIRLVQQKCKAYQSNINSTVSNPIASSLNTILPLRQITATNNSATSSSSSSISSYGASNNVIEQNEPRVK